jgi:carboxypeptidase Taq
MSDSSFDAFRDRMGEVLDLHSAVALLAWDQEVYMPPKAAPARGKQLATLSAHAHRLFTAPETGAMLAELEAAADRLDADAQRMVAETRYDYDRATRLPERFVQRFAEEQSKGYQAWVKAREQSDFAAFQPSLETMIELLREKADFLGYAGSPYNALVEDYERGMTAERLRAIFGDLAPRLSALIARIVQAPQPDLAWLDRVWDEQAQGAIGLRVLRDMGFDFEAGRQDPSVHPFTTNFDLYDVRITTRVNSRELFSALTGSIHEGGHALYEQGFQTKDRRTILAQAPSLGIHESQSRLWENIIGRSLPFWQRYTPLLRQYYPDCMEGITAGDIYRAINYVQPSLIRVEADECTYNLHIILRFEIEIDLLEGRLAVADVPEAWNAKMKQYLGIDVPNDALGCLQDIHWAHGSFGYFPTYTLGNLYSAQLFEKICEDLPDIRNQITEGAFAPLLGWLRAHVHEVGRRKTAPDIVRDATGREPDSEAFMRYLETKYGALYGLDGL